jgi:WD40 repeat protein
MSFLSCLEGRQAAGGLQCGINNPEARAVLGEMREPPQSSLATLGTAPSPDGKFKAVIGKDGKVRNFDLNKGNLIFQIDPHKGAARSIAYSADGKSVASRGADGTICVIDAGTGSIKYQIHHTEGAVLSLCLRQVDCLRWPRSHWAAGSRSARIPLFELKPPDGSVIASGVGVRHRNHSL